MKKKRSKEINANAAAGVSSTAGAVAGGVLGNVLAQEVQGHEANEELVIEEVATEQPQPEPQTAAKSQHRPSTESTIRTEPQPEPVPEPKPSPDEPVPETDMDIQVLSYETVDNNDGSQMDVAVVGVNGMPVVFADVDMDGTADLMVADVNGNQQIDNEEIVDISSEGIDMAPLKQEYENNNIDELAQVDEPDYTNNADVADYMA